MDPLGSTDSLIDQLPQAEIKNFTILPDSVEDTSPPRILGGGYQAGGAAQPALNIHGSQASITNMASGTKSMQNSKLAMQGSSLEYDNERDKENKFTFNPRISKYGQGFAN